MGRSVSYPSEAKVITFARMEDPDCPACDGCAVDEEGDTCMTCGGAGNVPACSDDYDMLIDDFRSHLRYLFPSVVSVDEWIGREDHVLAANGVARFGMSEYCGLVSYWIVPKEQEGFGPDVNPLAERWIANIADKFVAAFGELSKVGSMSNGEGVYRRIDK